MTTMPNLRGGACATRDGRYFPIFIGETLQISQARSVCARCPAAIFDECFAWALAHEDEGVWAGTTPEERRAIRDDRGITLRVITGSKSIRAKRAG